MTTKRGLRAGILTAITSAILACTVASPAAAYGVPYDPSPVVSFRKWTDANGWQHTEARRANGGSTVGIGKTTCRGYRCTLVSIGTTVIVSGGKRTTYRDKSVCTWDKRNPENTNYCRHS